jgi:iron-sulfur cluster assembly protein
MIAVTENAVRHLTELIAESGNTDADAGLRLFVEKGGCSGMSYGMAIACPADGDTTVEAGDVKVHVAADSGDLLRGVTLDYVDGLSGAGFKIINPNAARHCGCGTSFEPASGA